MIKQKHFFTVLLTLVFLLSSASTEKLLAGYSQEKKTTTQTVQKTSADVSKDVKDQADRAREAASVLTEMMGIPEQRVPDELMERATGIAVIPHVVKGAFGIGGRYGKGLMAQRLANGQWSTPTYIEIGGGSFGLQIGVEATDLVLVFTNKEGVQSLMKGKVKLGADATVAAGPLGRKGEIGTDIRLNSAIYSYSRSKGLFAGVSLDGAVISVDDTSNQKVYGKNVDANAILMARQARNSVVAPFMDALQKWSPARTTKASQ